MTTSTTRQLTDLITQTGAVRIQPVPPEPHTWKEIVGEFLGQLLALALHGWFVCLATLVAHDYWPAVPPLGFWASVAILLGLSAVGHAVRGPAWKWARR